MSLIFISYFRLNPITLVYTLNNNKLLENGLKKFKIYLGRYAESSNFKDGKKIILLFVVLMRQNGRGVRVHSNRETAKNTGPAV